MIYRYLFLISIALTIVYFYHERKIDFAYSILSSITAASLMEIFNLIIEMNKK